MLFSLLIVIEKAHPHSEVGFSAYIMQSINQNEYETCAAKLRGSI